MDLEAPSIHQAFGNYIAPKTGLVDFLYQKAIIGKQEKSHIQITDIIGEVTVLKGKLFVIPAGKVNDEYVAKLDDLRNLPVFNQDIWNEIKKEIVNQLHPDLIIVDSRTGFNIWGALSLLTVADEAIIFTNPNPQNREGIITILSALNKVNIDYTVVLSPVLSNPVGRKQALEEWESISKEIYEKNKIQDRVDELDEIEDEPLMIPYSSEIALAGTYPLKPLLSLYYDLTNILDGEADAHKLSAILAGRERWQIIRSLEFPHVDAKSENNPVKQLFQKTGDFDQFIENTTMLVRGKKGTGKTQLYYTTLNFPEVVKEKAKGRLDNVIAMSGHGPVTPHPGKEDFAAFNRAFNEKNIPWDRFWKVYAFYRLITKPETKGAVLSKRSLKQLNEAFKNRPSVTDRWSTEHTNFILSICLQDHLELLIRDALHEINSKLEKESKYAWLLYDDLDQDIQEYTKLQNEAISGLFTFALSLETSGIRNIRLKIFLRNDIWYRLNFTNKSHLVGRDVELKWTREDFLRLAYRQASLSSDFHNIVAKFSPISDPDTASEQSLEKALELLWGIDREKGKKSKKVARWVHERLTDASGCTFPRSLSILLRNAKSKELEYQNQPHIPAPTDRLLRANSLNEGLFAASRERCEELRQEFKELDEVGFFTMLGSVQQITDLEPILTWWKSQESIGKLHTKFEDFTDLIQQMGLAAPYDDKRWRFADIYVHGFKMKRAGGRL